MIGTRLALGGDGVARRVDRPAVALAGDRAAGTAGPPSAAAPIAPRRAQPRPPRPGRRPSVAVVAASSSASSAASYSPTDANTGSPADAASARADASGATMSSRRPRHERLAGEQPEVDPRRRDPRPERQHEPRPAASSAARIRDAAEVISSSASR